MKTCLRRRRRANCLFYCSFFNALRTPSFKNRTFLKNQPHFPLYFPQFSRRHVLFCAISCKFYHQKPKQFLIFFTPKFHNFRTISRNTIFNISRNTILTISTLTNTSKFLHKLPLNLCTKLLPKKCINSINHARNRFYLHN